MDNKFYIENFEEYLKEKSDEFRMYPSQRVWNSIYNNMHPGSRWPSISMCIILICALFLVGFLNTNVPNKDHLSAINNDNKRLGISSSVFYNMVEEKYSTANLITDASTDPMLLVASSEAVEFSSKDNSFTSPVQTVQYQINVPVIAQANNNQENTTAFIPTPTGQNASTVEKLIAVNETTNANADYAVITGTVNTSSADKVERAILNDNTAGNLFREGNLETATEGYSLIEKNNYYPVIVGEKTPVKIQAAILPLSATKTTTTKSANNNFLSEADKYWIENYAMYNRPAPKKWKGKVNWETYITPSVVYRTLTNNTAKNNNGMVALANSSDIDNSITNTPSFGVELGTGLQYELSKRLKMKAGVQLNFTRYNSQGYDNGHPVATTLTMNSDDGNYSYEVYRASPYSSSYGLDLVKLHNQTLQLSLPVGANFRIASADNLEWYMGATIQPTFVLGGQSYLISTDRRNYVKESDMLNRFNLNAGFETFISIKTSAFTWQIGPQFRTQLFSTNSKIYSVQERLLNYGLKVGITKKL